MRTLKIIAALIASVALVLGGSTLASSSPNPITAKYHAPSDVNVQDFGCDNVTVTHDGSAHADFYVVKFSTFKDMSNATYVGPSDLRDKEYDITGLAADDTYYFQVAVVDSERHRLSPYSTKFAERTDAVC